MRAVANAHSATTAHIGQIIEARRADLLGRPGAPLEVIDGIARLP